LADLVERGGLLLSDRLSLLLLEPLDLSVGQLPSLVLVCQSSSEAGREDGKQVSFDSEPYASTGLKALVGVLRLLPIESQL
jgi:hypothetical protein